MTRGPAYWLCGLACAVLAALVATGARAETGVRVEIEGLKGALLENARAYLGLVRLERRAETGILRGLTARAGRAPGQQITERSVRRLVEKAPAEVREALRPLGYYEPEVTAELRREGEGWVARLRVVPGPAVRVARLDLRVLGEGRDDRKMRRVIARFPLHPGDVLSHAAYREGKDKLVRAALRRGYLDAGYGGDEGRGGPPCEGTAGAVRGCAQLRVDLARHEAEVHLHLDTGPRFYLGDVRVEQDILAPEVVMRYVRLRPGEPFSTERLLGLQSSLSASGYFATVEVQARREAARDHRIPVVVETTPRRPRRYELGLGFSTDTGPRATAKVRFRRINRRGHQVEADARASPVLSGVSARYLIPVPGDQEERWVVEGSAEVEAIDAGDTTRYSLGLRQERRWLGAQRRLFLDYSYEDFSLGEDDDQVGILIAGAGLSRIQADDAIFARRGYSWSADLRGAAQGLLSETSFVRLELNGHLVRPLGERGRFLTRAQLGALAASDFSRLSTSERFYAGGDQSVRGYDYRSLGPTDDSGDNTGGRYLVSGSIEADYLVFGNFGVAAFLDAGDATDRLPRDLELGVGLGLRWRSPVGMVKVDLAHPLDDSTPVRLHISFGSGL